MLDSRLRGNDEVSSFLEIALKGQFRPWGSWKTPEAIRPIDSSNLTPLPEVSLKQAQRNIQNLLKLVIQGLNPIH
jgi:hypothetical protein